MVVTRKTSIPIPPTSRTSSTQATPRLNKGKVSQSLLAQELETSYSNGITPPEANHSSPQFSDDALFSDSSTPRKVTKDRTKGKPKKKEKVLSRRRRQPTSWLDLFSRMFILAFLIYTLSVCPTDRQQSSVCRALSEYRRLILEPYVITPFQSLLQHPAVSPYAARVIDTTKPVIRRSQKEWNTRIVPQWKAHVVPKWERHVLPQWNAHVLPRITRLDANVAPYRQAIYNSYNKNVAPYVAYVERAARKMQPYVLHAAVKSYDAYQFSKPHLARAYGQLQRVPPLVVKYVLTPLDVARRQFVDPHVALLVEKIKELSSGTAKVTTGEPDRDKITSVPASTPETILDTEGKSESVRFETSPVPEATQQDETLGSAAPIMSASVFFGDQATESVPGATYSPEMEPELKQTELEPESKLETIVKGKAETTSEPKTVYFTEIATTVETVIGRVTETVELPIQVTAAAQKAEEVIEKAPASRLSRPVPSPLVVDDSKTSDDDLDGFYAELGLDADETVSTSDVPDASPSIVEETEEEKAAREAARLAEIAKKRRELEARHTKWEEKLAETIEAQSVVLRNALGSIRQTAAVQFKSSLEIREAVETLHAESEKALRGTEAYFTKLAKGRKPRNEKVRLWDRVLGKVEAKFDERVRSVEEIVNSWYEEEVLSKEGREIEATSNTVKGVAEDGQADIGLDYAWLDDVTYMDWRRYHALLEKHKAWLDESLALVNGSHSTPYPNPVADVFKDLQAEVQDITVGFETRLRRIKREGDRALATESDAASEGNTQGSEPEVSVLPISSGGTAQSKPEEEILQEVAEAIIGRSEEEVVAALGRADAHPEEEQVHAKIAHEEL